MRTDTVKGDTGHQYKNLLWEILTLNLRDYLKARLICNGRSIEETLGKALENIGRKYSGEEQGKKIALYWRDKKRIEDLRNGLEAKYFIFDETLVVGDNIDFTLLCKLLDLDPVKARNTLGRMTHKEIKTLLKESGFKRI